MGHWDTGEGENNVCVLLAVVLERLCRREVIQPKMADSYILEEVGDNCRDSNDVIRLQSPSLRSWAQLVSALAPSPGKLPSL